MNTEAKSGERFAEETSVQARGGAYFNKVSDWPGVIFAKAKSGKRQEKQHTVGEDKQEDNETYI